MGDEIDVTKLKYVLYARKSSIDESRQVRSIPDQIKECQQLAKRLGLHVTKVLEESRSAKTPNIRPVFSQMIKDIEKGLYDAILSWNPDRLARNMLEGGLIVNLIDENVIKDLKFVTHFFTRDANGKMLLGMSFVLSKQYSDDLSQKVTRGVRSRFSEGKVPTPKYGYINEKGIYEPDGKNFELICGAWQKRKRGNSIESISDWLNREGLYRIVKKTGQKLGMSTQKLSEIFEDSFYYGVLVQAKQQVDLREIYDFQPAVSEEDYNIVQSLSFRRIKPGTPHKIAFYPLRMMILCSFCNNPMYVGPSTSGTGKRYLSYRCDNELCSRHKKSIRAKEIFKFIYDFLEGGLNLTEIDYKKYYNDMVKISDDKRVKIRMDLNSRQGALKAVRSDIKERSLKIIDYQKDSPIWKINNQKIEELLEKEKQINQDIEELKKQLTDPEKDRLTLEEFLNLSKNASTIVKMADERIKDEICRRIFLNLTVDEKKVMSYQLKEPFATLLKSRSLLPSRGCEI